MQEPVRLGLAGSVEAVGQLRLAMRSYFSTNFLWTALHLDRLVGELEGADGRRPRFDMAHRSYAVSSVIASAAFLEAVASELFQDAIDGHGLTDTGYLASLAPDAVTAMATLWRETAGGRDLEPVEKWQRLLECSGPARLDAGAPPVQDAALLVRLRNALVHFKPETIAADEAHLLERQLKGKFRDNQLMAGAGNPWWPSHGLGQGCTSWAVHAARQLSDSVLDTIGVTANYTRIEAAGWNGRRP